MGQTDGRIAVSLNAPYGGGITSGQRILTKGRIVPVYLSPPRRVSPCCPCGQVCCVVCCVYSILHFSGRNEPQKIAPCSLRIRTPTKYTWFLEPTRVNNPNRISFDSVGFVSNRHTDRQTDSLCCNCRKSPHLCIPCIHTARSTQPCIPPGSLNRVPALLG